MNHKVLNVSELHKDAKEMFETSVVGSDESSADMILSNLQEGIQILKNTWEGRDAGVQIQNAVRVYNGMVTLRNELGLLAQTTTEIAANYREIQNINGGGADSLTVVKTGEKTFLEDYVDIRDTVNITEEANNGKAKLVSAQNGLEVFQIDANTSLSKIMDNWLAGTGRDKARELFDNFQSDVTKYKEVLSKVVESVATALENYNY